VLKCECCDPPQGPTGLQGGAAPNFGLGAGAGSILGNRLFRRVETISAATRRAPAIHHAIPFCAREGLKKTFYGKSHILHERDASLLRGKGGEIVARARPAKRGAGPGKGGHKRFFFETSLAGSGY